MPKNFVLLFHRAYPSVYQGTKEADTLGQTVLVNQFVAGLLPEIKSKIVGCEGDFNQLLTKARFEEAKLHDLGPSQLAPVPPQSPVTQGERFGRKPVFMPRLQLGGTRSSIGPRYYNCGSPSHLIRQCPYSLKNRPSETPAQNKVVLKIEIILTLGRVITLSQTSHLMKNLMIIQIVNRKISAVSWTK